MNQKAMLGKILQDANIVNDWHSGWDVVINRQYREEILEICTFGDSLSGGLL